MNKKKVVSLNKEERERLIDNAKEAMKKAYTPLANFKVGAAVLTERGSIYQGCNIQSTISGMGICAERNAIDHAVVHGEYLIKAIAEITPLNSPIRPCGMCLQYIAEFSEVSNYDIKILMVSSSGEIAETTIEKILPDFFGWKSIGITLDEYRNS